MRKDSSFHAAADDDDDEVSVTRFSFFLYGVRTRLAYLVYDGFANQFYFCFSIINLTQLTQLTHQLGQGWGV